MEVPRARRQEDSSTPKPRVHERIRQHLIYSRNLPLDTAIIVCGDYLRESIVLMTLPMLREG